MNTAELKALADQCICHPASRGIADIEAAGEGLKHLISQLEDAQGEILALRYRAKELESGLFSIVDGFRILKDSDFPALAKCRALLEKTNEQD